MTHLLDTSALLAHYLGEPGAPAVQAIFDNRAFSPGTSILALFEFDLRLHQLGFDSLTRQNAIQGLQSILEQVVPVDEAVRAEAIRLRTEARSRISTVDVLIAATARIHGAIFIHRDPHFEGLPPDAVEMIVLDQK